MKLRLLALAASAAGVAIVACSYGDWSLAPRPAVGMCEASPCEVTYDAAAEDASTLADSALDAGGGVADIEDASFAPFDCKGSLLCDSFDDDAGLEALWTSTPETGARTTIEWFGSAPSPPNVLHTWRGRGEVSAFVAHTFDQTRTAQASLTFKMFPEKILMTAPTCVAGFRFSEPDADTGPTTVHVLKLFVYAGHAFLYERRAPKDITTGDVRLNLAWVPHLQTWTQITLAVEPGEPSHIVVSVAGKKERLPAVYPWKESPDLFVIVGINFIRWADGTEQDGEGEDVDLRYDDVRVDVR